LKDNEKKMTMMQAIEIEVVEVNNKKVQMYMEVAFAVVVDYVEMFEIVVVAVVVDHMLIVMMVASSAFAFAFDLMMMVRWMVTMIKGKHCQMNRYEIEEEEGEEN
jgi:uncharacterized membrane protein (UPF0182 family)